jgi:RimJ/RimL family protein N-acetyltransferase
LEAAYLFTSERLGFRNWLDKDVQPMSALNSDPEVMKYFPRTQTLANTQTFITRMQHMFAEKGYCYFAVDLLEDHSFIGFIGLMWQKDKALPVPYTDIGWRLKRSAWGNGYATEGAQACLKYAFQQLKLDRLLATATVENAPSESVMKKIGMHKIGEYNDPVFEHHPIYNACCIYEIRAEDYQAKNAH